MITKEHELKHTLENLSRPPALVITDSQAFLKVSADTPADIPLTSPDPVCPAKNRSG